MRHVIDEYISGISSDLDTQYIVFSKVRIIDQCREFADVQRQRNWLFDSDQCLDSHWRNCPSPPPQEMAFKEIMSINYIKRVYSGFHNLFFMMDLWYVGGYILLVLSFTYRPVERLEEELELINEELVHIEALSHLSSSVKKELASVLIFESHLLANTVRKFSFLSSACNREENVGLIRIDSEVSHKLQRRNVAFGRLFATFRYLARPFSLICGLDRFLTYYFYILYNIFLYL